VEDRAIVQALCDRDRSGLEAAYDRYARRLFDYCVGLLHDHDAAGDAVHDTLLVAADRAQQLRDPERLRAWLYAIARNECLRQLRQRNRLAPLEKAGDVTDDSIDLGRSVQAQQAQALVRDAVAGLNPREQEVLNLTLRHELSGAELAAALGVTTNHAHALTSKAREQLERSVGALLTARAGRADCAELDTMLANWDGVFTPLLRKRVSRHLEQCAVCGPRRAHEVRAEALFAAVPFAVLPVLLRRRVLDSSADLKLVSNHGRIALPFERDGFPAPLDRRSRRSRAAAWLAGAAVFALLIGGGVAMTVRPGAQTSLADPPREPLVAQTESPSASPLPSVVTPSLSPTPSVRPSPSRTPRVTPSRRPIVTVPSRRPVPPRVTRAPSPTPTRRVTPSPRPSPSSPKPVPPTPVVTASLPVSDGCPGETWSSTGGATVTGAVARTVTFFWRTAEGAPHSSPMSGGGGKFNVRLTGLPVGEQVFYRAEAVSTDGVTGRSAEGSQLVQPCGEG
jgi:RNA polymerase sigma factor (sigma-70 family)